MTKPDCRGGALVKVKLKMVDGKPVVTNPRYKLFFVQHPSGRGDNFKVIPEEMPGEVRADQRGAFDTFMKRTHDLVMSKNVNVPQDTIR